MVLKVENGFERIIEIISIANPADVSMSQDVVSV
jgi:hypothetical protein